MLSNILVDKLQFYINTKTNYIHDNMLTTFNDVFKHHFAEGAYSTFTKYGRTTVRLTPTRYFPEYTSLGDDYNIDMPPEEELYKLFQEMGLYSYKSNYLGNFIISELHLTKNILTDANVLPYIKVLGDRKYKSKFNAIWIKSSTQNATLNITTLTRNNHKDSLGDRNFIHYDKIQELKDKKNRKHLNVRLKYPLNVREIALLPQHVYCSATNSIILDNLNILRIEQQYKGGRKLKPLAIYLGAEDGVLRLSMLLALLKEGKLYSKLNEFYTKQEKEIVFINLPLQEVKLKENERLLKHLAQEHDTSFLIELFPTEAQKRGLQATFKKLQSNTENDVLYNEIYRKIID